MKKSIILAVILVVCPFTLHAMSFAKAQQIYNKILMANGHVLAPRLVLSPSKAVNAYGSAIQITVNQGMLDFVGNDEHQMALILGHELGHARGYGAGPAQELKADKYGARQMSNAGYSVCRGAAFHRRMNNPPTKTHPSSKERVKALGC